MTPDEAIKIVESKAQGRTRHEGQRAFLDEVLVTEIKRLKADLIKEEKLYIECNVITTKMIKDLLERTERLAPIIVRLKNENKRLRNNNG